MDIYVFIYLPGVATAVPAGRFTYDPEARTGMFEYGSRYMARRQACAVDPIALPLGLPAPVALTNGGLYGAFRDASPDLWGRMVIAKRLNIPLETLSEGELLLSGNASRVGNLDFRHSVDAEESTFAPPAVQRLSEILDAAALLEAHQPIQEDMRQLLDQGTSLGGARPKCLVEMDEALWMAKFPSRGDQWNHTRVEWATMTLAGRCGIRIPEMRMVQAGGHDVLLVRRFDRDRIARGYARKGFLSALSILQLDERDRHAFSYLSLADALRRHGIGGKVTLEQLFRRMVFNIFCRNTDDHPRNHGALFDGDSSDLSPAFDITPTRARPGVGENFFLSMDVGALGRVATIGNALSGAARFGLTQEVAHTIIDELVETRAGWRSVFEECRVSEQDVDSFKATFEPR